VLCKLSDSKALAKTHMDIEVPNHVYDQIEKLAIKSGDSLGDYASKVVTQHQKGLLGELESNHGI